ncbi:MAG: class II fructose-bisphosphate aldolase [Arthrobacter sp.]|uniref:class II fructose-bisphosphate aldolase n=1 Tax=unclassified Arthrobacter TaxID=235627 RepID=UPI002654F427|nr:class II fructose-bisphosphate aldolase [Micrococcaceae bacterium]MDN5812882.1 class II fructose-bisphosphate aldolase [Micrococcaceae bacterium]MDN5878933.1 class II fructose-bisphosphate aldolase [Micrococcaceae bacterium]MDN5886352.1 class II fructose-bisphosphate aldolase [Micrococcaceae bacterium]MDN5905629.1 class II fructose-bisphosphate aldolase [Micrococcaceae bacterium]
MALSTTRELMTAAADAGRGQGAFNVIHLETAEALVAGAEEAGLPVILQISENCVAYHGALEPIGLACLAIARGASVPVSVHLDHAESEELALQAVELGFGSVMYDGAHLDYDDNVAATARVARYAHDRGVYIEAELGKVGGKGGAHAPGVRTDPAEAAAFVAATGVDALAVAVGSSHAMTSRSAELDVELISRLADAVDVPLVLHGSSGVSDENIVAAIRAGMRKINVSTHLNGFFTAGIREYLAADETVVDSRKYVGAGRARMAKEAGRMLGLFALQDDGSAPA